MIENFKKMFRVSMFTSIFFMIIGLFLFFKPETTITTISYVLGSFIMFVGIIFLIKYFTNKKLSIFVSSDLVYGVISTILGLIIILNPTAIAKVIPFILGIWIVIGSITKIQYLLQLKENKNKAWLSSMVIAVITFVWGIILIFNPFAGAMVVTKIIGMFILVYAILDLVEIFIIKKSFTIVKKEVEKIMQ